MDAELRQKAIDYMLLKEKREKIDESMKELEVDLLKNGETLYFLNLKKKLVFVEKKDKTEINSESLFDQLWKEQRLSDIQTTFSIKQKDLLTLPDGEDLLKKYKFTNGFTKASLRVTEMSKKEIKLEESKVND